LKTLNRNKQELGSLKVGEPHLNLLQEAETRFLSLLGEKLPLNSPAFTQIMLRHRKRFDNRVYRALFQAFSELPRFDGLMRPVVGSRVAVETAEILSDDFLAMLETALMKMVPWRKGPFDLFSVFVDAEWRSDFKWDRLEKHLPDLKGKRVLDVGCSNGYYMYRMSEHQPEFILGIDPSELFFVQFHAMQRYLQVPELYYLPLKLEEIKVLPKAFDVVFCMGILYHQRSPLDALRSLQAACQKGGRVVLETLVYPGEDPIAFCPPGRYAKMPNVHFLPTVSCLTQWMEKAGFTNLEVLPLDQTRVEEQRRTPWTKGESLADFLDPKDPTKTVEGYPGPTRVCIIGECRL